MDRLVLKARAKVNLGLDVVGKLENGYHLVDMIMQTVDIYDELSFSVMDAPGIVLTVDSEDNLGDITNNLIYKAAKLMIDQFSINKGIEINLKKNIPVAAGMAGGSTDAAATMIAMNELFELGKTKEELMDLGVQLGADIPFCILGGTALAEGIGEELKSLKAPKQSVVLIAKPGIMVSTKETYEDLHVETLTEHPDIDAQIKALEDGDFTTLLAKMGNVLETVTVKKHPVIQQIKETMLECGALNAMMSGSGPTVFGIFEDEEKAKNALAELKAKKLAKDLAVTSFYNE